MNEARFSPDVGADQSDEALIRTIVSRSGSDEAERATTVLLGRYRDQIYIWCYRYVKDHEKALDMAQEVLMTAYSKLATYEHRSRFNGWLFMIARNRCLSELRRPSMFYDDNVDLDELATRQGNPAQILEDKLSEEKLLDLIRDNLEPLEQKAIWMRCLDRLPVDAITTMLEIEEASGARAVLQRARRKLRAVMAGKEQSGEWSAT